MFAADGGDAGRRARNGIYVKAALSCARAAEAVRAEGLIPSTERDAVRYLSDLIFGGNTVYRTDPGWGVKWTESWLRRKYGGEALDALTRQAAERLALLPEGAREAAKPGILSETFGPLAEHLLVGDGGSQMPEDEAWTDDGDGGIITTSDADGENGELSKHDTI